MKALAALLVLCSMLVSCGENTTIEDSEATTGSSEVDLTAAEREWCSFADASDDSALKFDLIFEAGLILQLPMDALNAQAGELLDEYVQAGMSVDEAARRVSSDLLQVPTFIAACKEAYANNEGRG
jgi:hypothetical protein